MNLLDSFYEAMAAEQAAQLAWCKELLNDGVVLAHSDDGWIDRVNNESIFALPVYKCKEELDIGDVVAIGNPKSFARFRIDGTTPGILGEGTHYSYVPV